MFLQPLPLELPDVLVQAGLETTVVVHPVLPLNLHKYVPVNEDNSMMTLNVTVLWIEKH